MNAILTSIIIFSMSIMYSLFMEILGWYGINISFELIKPFISFYVGIFAGINFVGKLIGFKSLLILSLLSIYCIDQIDIGYDKKIPLLIALFGLTLESYFNIQMQIKPTPLSGLYIIWTMPIFLSSILTYIYFLLR